jgi:hypothetical protein
MKRYLAMSYVFTLLYGCGSQPTITATPLPIVAPKEEVNIPPELLEKCPPMKTLPVRKYAQGETLVTAQTWQDMYTACANKQAKLSDLTAEAFDITKTPVPAAKPVK